MDVVRRQVQHLLLSFGIRTERLIRILLIGVVRGAAMLLW